MSKLPRDLSSEDLCRALKPLGYEITRARLVAICGSRHERIMSTTLRFPVTVLCGLGQSPPFFRRWRSISE
jgi:hypothetical protein